MDENEEKKDEITLTEDQKSAIKYRFLKNKILKFYEKSTKYIRVAKILVVIFFLIYTAVAVIIAKNTGNIMEALTNWVILIFFNVFVFMFIDYFSAQAGEKIIPYLKDDDRVEYERRDLLREDLTPKEEDEE